jgi:hypothetical protein
MEVAPGPEEKISLNPVVLALEDGAVFQDQSFDASVELR